MRYKNTDAVAIKEERDLAEVVCCKDCKRRYEPTRCALWYGACNAQHYFLEHGDDFYCAYGERSNENAE